MRETDRERFFAAWCGSHELIGAAIPTARALGMAFEILRDLPLDVIRAALLDHARSSPYPPKPADVVRFARGSAEDRARLAWQEVLALVGAAGSWSSVRAGSPAIHYAVERMGGWPQLCEGLDASTLPFRERDFARHHGDAERMGLAWGAPGVPDHLAGRIEVANLAGGHPDDVPPPVSLEDIRRRREESAALARRIRHRLEAGADGSPRALPGGEPDGEARARNVERLKSLLAGSVEERREDAA